MKVLVIGGTRFFGVPMVEDLLKRGNEVTIATRGITEDYFGKSVQRITFDLFDKDSIISAFQSRREYDVVIDKISYSSNEMKSLIDSINPKRYIYTSTANVYELNHYNIVEEEFTGQNGKIRWNDRLEASYENNKRNSERVLCQYFESDNWVAIRYPIVLGKMDYTERLLYYVSHIMRSIPMRHTGITSMTMNAR